MEMTKSKDRMQTVEESYVSILGFKKSLEEELGKDWLYKCRRSGEVAKEEVPEYNEVIHNVCIKEIARYLLLKMDTEEDRMNKVSLLYMNFPKLYEKIEAKMGKHCMWELKQSSPDCKEEICMYNFELKKFFQEKMVQYTI